MGRILELDAIRGIAALIIMMAHIGLMPDSPWIFSAVDMFFVLSGFLITKNVLGNRTKPNFLPIFLARRSLRIWPAYYLALGACVAIHPFVRWDAPLKAWPYYLTFTQNVHDYLGWAKPSFSGMFLHTWTMAIEEQFYVLWPLLLFRGGGRWILLVVATFAALPAGMRVAGYSPYLLLTRCDGLAYGSLLALLMWDRAWVNRHVRGLRWGFAALGLSALVIPPLVGMPVPDVTPGLGLVGPTWTVSAFLTRACLVYMGLAGFLLCAEGLPALMPLRFPVFCHLGVISYGLYLYHPMVFATLPHLFQRNVLRRIGVSSTLVRDVAMLGACVLVAELSRRFVELPIQRWKDKVTGRARTEARDGAAATSSITRGPHRPPVAVARERDATSLS